MKESGILDMGDVNAVVHRDYFNGDGIVAPRVDDYEENTLSYLLANDMLISSANSSAFSFVSCDFETICLNLTTLDNFSLSILFSNIDNSNLGMALNSDSNSAGILILNSSMRNSNYNRYLKFSNAEEDNEACLSRLGGHSALKTCFVPQVLIQNELSRSGQGTVNKNEIIYLNVSANYPNNSIISLFDNISTLDCSLNAGSFDQIGQFIFNASAKNGMSLSCISCSACDSNSLNESLGIALINLSNSDIFELNCFELGPEYFKISCLFFFNSSIAYSGDNNCKFNDLELEIISLTGLDLKNDTNIFVSTTKFIYQPSALYLFHIPFLILSPISRASLSDSFSDSNCFSICSFHNNCLVLDSMHFLTNPDQFISGNFFICSLISPGTDNVIDTILFVEKRKYVEVFKPFVVKEETKKIGLKVKFDITSDWFTVIFQRFDFENKSSKDGGLNGGLNGRLNGRLNYVKLNLGCWRGKIVNSEIIKYLDINYLFIYLNFLVNFGGGLYV